MNFVVVDFEWNQAMRSNSSVFDHIPIRLHGEIIEIGAVKINVDMTLGEEFTIDVRPVYFRKIHHTVKKITGFDKERLSNGVSFPEAFEQFRTFCGEDVIFLTWGNDDRGIFEQNVILHDLDFDWIADWINLQLIYNVQTGGDKNQKSLVEAMEHFGIEQTRVAHDALGDAYNTALVCTHLDMKEGMRTYDEAPRILASRMPHPVKEVSESNMPGTLAHDGFGPYESKASALADPAVSCPLCPHCGTLLEGLKWVNQGDGRYMNIYSCREDGSFLVRIRFRKDTETGEVYANRLIYNCDEEMTAFYREKSTQARRRGRGRRTRNSVTSLLRKQQRKEH